MYLCWQLLRLTGDPLYADEMERSLDNALLGALLPDGRWWGYYDSLMGPRVPSLVMESDVGLSCCVCSGSRALMLTPSWAVMQAADGPVLNLYFPGKAEARTASGARVALTLDTDYPREGTVRLLVRPARAETFTVALRIPAWSRATTLAVNGVPQPVQAGTYAKVRRLWADGDRVELVLDMRLQVVDAPDGNGQVALKRGPVVLAMDDRLAPAEKNAVAVLERNSGPLLRATSNPRAAQRIGAWIALDVPLLVNGSRRMLTLCDYASAGNGWSTDNRFRTWLPQPLSLDKVYKTGVTWKKLTATSYKPDAPPRGGRPPGAR
jgi:DUF1680 family protein